MTAFVTYSNYKSAINIILVTCCIPGVDLEKDIRVIPVSYGGLVLFQNMIPHRRYDKNVIGKVQ